LFDDDRKSGPPDLRQSFRFLRRQALVAGARELRGFALTAMAPALPSLGAKYRPRHCPIESSRRRLASATPLREHSR
jgi:hypothetical protein